jgi:hypothetical protein
MMKWRHQNCGPQPGALGSRSNRGCERERLAEVAVIEPVVLGEPQRVDAKGIGFFAQLQGEGVQPGWVLAPALRVAQVEVETNVHTWHSPSREQNRLII